MTHEDICLRDVTVSHTNLQTKPLKPSCIWVYVSAADSKPEFMSLYPNKGKKEENVRFMVQFREKKVTCKFSVHSLSQYRACSDILKVI